MEEQIRLVMAPGSGIDKQQICLICTTTVESRGYHNNLTLPSTEVNLTRIKLKTVCETLELGGTELILNKMDVEDLFTEVTFCTQCQCNLDNIKRLQDQIQLLNQQLQELMTLVTSCFSVGSSRLSGFPGMYTNQLRNYIQEELPVPTKTLCAMDLEHSNPLLDCHDDHHFEAENLLHDDPLDVADNDLTPVSRPVGDGKVEHGVVENWNVKQEGLPIGEPLVIKPCEVWLIRLDDGDPRLVPSRNTRSRTNKRRSTQGFMSRTGQHPGAKTKKITGQVLSSDDDQPLGTTRKHSHPCTIEGCHVRVRSWEKVGHHVRQVHEGLDKPFNCLACDNIEFRTTLELKGHVDKEHSRRKRSKSNPGGVTCPKCERKLAYYNDLILHIRRQGGTCSREPRDLFGTRSTTRPSIRRTKRIYKQYKYSHQCELCPKVYPRRFLLEIHVEADHHGNLPYLCEHCCKGFTRRQTLMEHQRLHHSKEYMETFNVDETSFTENLKSRHCDICNKTFGNAVIKKKHDAIHTQDYTFRCCVCGAGFMGKSNLEQHELTHTGARNFACTKCPLKFKRSGQLQRHLERIHPPEGKTKSCECEFCEKRFWDKTALNRHLRIMHREALPKDQVPEFVCTVCNYTCVDKTYLTVHNKTKRHKENVEAAQASSSPQGPMILGH